MKKHNEQPQSTNLPDPGKPAQTEEISAIGIESVNGTDFTASEGKGATAKSEFEEENSSSDRDPLGQQAENSSLVGTVIDGRYEVEKCLGVGAMGSVFLVRHLRLEKSFALKMVNPELAEHKEFVARFEREANACSRLDHPNCISVTDFGHTQTGSLYLVMEYVDGVSLNELTYRTPATLEEAFEYTRQVLLGLEHAHSKGLIHRDIKLENIMCCSRASDDIQVKILDFGMAKSPERKQENLAITRKGVVLGTPQYMAPEQLRNQPTDERSDLYSLGVMLFRLITGTIVFAGDTMIDVFASKLTRPAPSLQDVTAKEYPEPLEKFICKALQRNPDDRFSSAAEMLSELERVELTLFGRVSRSPLGNDENEDSGKMVGGAAEFWRTIFDHPIDDAVYWYTCGRSPRRANWNNRFHSLFNDRVGKLVLIRFVLVMALVLVLSLVGVLYHFSDELLGAFADNVVNVSEHSEQDIPAAGSDEKHRIELGAQPSSGSHKSQGEKPTEAGSLSRTADVAVKPEVPAQNMNLSEDETAADIEPGALLESRLLIEQKQCRLAETKLTEYIDTLGKKPAMGYLLLGRSQICLGKPRRALTFYKNAIDLDDRYRFDAGIIEDLKRMISKDTARNKSLDFMIEVLGDAALPTLIKYAGHQQRKDVRHRARAHVEEVGALEHVNMEASFDWDLNQTGDCKERKAIVYKLAALGTARAKQILKRARDSEVRVNLFRRRYKHECVRKDIVKALASMGNTKANQ